MRVSTDMLYRQGVAGIVDRQIELLKVQKQLTTGLKHATAGDHPAEFAEGLTLDQRIADLARYQENASAARHRLSVEDSTLGSVTAVLQRVREFAIQGNNDSYGDEERRQIVAELQQQLDHLISLSNQDDGEGNFIFSGSNSTVSPFARTAGGVSYAGDQTPRFIAVGPDREIADGNPGSEVFQRIANGNGTYRFSAGASNTGSGTLARAELTNPAAYDGDTYTLTFTTASSYEVRNSAGALITSGSYTEGAAITFQGVGIAIGGTPASGDVFTVARSTAQDLFATVQSAIDALSTSTATPASDAQMHNRVFNALQDLDQALGHVLEVRATIGGRLNALEDTLKGQDALELQLKETLSGLRDLDYAEAVSRLQQALTTLEASQQSFLKVQGLSLFNFLR